MAKSFTGTEFVKALAEGTLREPISLEGMVKKCESGTDAVLFAEGMSCLHWTRIPVEMIEEVDFISTVPCRDHEHPFVRLSLKEPTNDVVAQVFADLLRNSARRAMVDAEDFPEVGFPVPFSPLSDAGGFGASAEAEALAGLVSAPINAAVESHVVSGIGAARANAFRGVCHAGNASPCKGALK